MENIMENTFVPPLSGIRSDKIAFIKKTVAEIADCYRI